MFRKLLALFKIDAKTQQGLPCPSFVTKRPLSKEEYQSLQLARVKGAYPGKLTSSGYCVPTFKALATGAKEGD